MKKLMYQKNLEAVLIDIKQAQETNTPKWLKVYLADRANHLIAMIEQEDRARCVRRGFHLKGFEQFTYSLN